MPNILNLIDDARCFETVRAMRWPQGVTCPSATLPKSRNRGTTKPSRNDKKYECTVCRKRFDDLTGTIFAGHHQPLRVWMLCLYFMGLNLSNEQIAHELDLNSGDAQKMTTQLRVRDKVSGTGFGHIDVRKSFSVPDTFSRSTFSRSAPRTTPS